MSKSRRNSVDRLLGGAIPPFPSLPTIGALLAPLEPPHARHDRRSIQHEHGHVPCSKCVDLYCSVSPPTLVPSGASFLRRHHCFWKCFLCILPVPLALLISFAWAPPASHACCPVSPDTHVPRQAHRTCSQRVRGSAV